MNGHQLYLKPDEAKFLGMAIAAMIEDIAAASSNPKINWNPEARASFKEMLTAGKALKIKFEKLGIPVGELPPYFDGDEEQYLTKQS